MKTIFSIIIVLILQINLNAQPVTTFAGSGNWSNNNGPVATASFKDPYGIAIAANGDVYVADSNNHKIRKISGGMVTDFAGSTGFGSTDGPAATAKFYMPFGIAIDSSGNIIVADTHNNKIRKITPSGMVSTVAGTGVAGNSDGNASTATFNIPRGVAVDASDNIYVVDSFDHKIRKISPAGMVSTFAGSGSQGTTDGTGTAASFNTPLKIAIDASGNIFVTDYGNHKIRKISPTGVVTTFAGSGTQGNLDGSGTSAQFHLPAGICVDHLGNIYVADAGNNRIRKINPSGVVTTLAGTDGGFLNGDASIAKFLMPTDVKVDAAGNIIVADTSNDRIRKIGDNTLSTIDFQTNSLVKIYPNSFTDEVNISFENSEKAELEILDMNGRLISKKPLNQKKNLVNTSGLKSGVYLFRMNISGKITTIKGIRK